MSLLKNPKAKWLMFIMFLIISSLWILIPAIPQDPQYHLFADQRTHWGIPNFFNVISNLPFIFVGVWGVISTPSANVIKSNQTAYIIFFAGIFLVGLGSAYYHLYPSHFSLIWDRLPMTIGFMALLSFVISEHIEEDLGQKSLYPLLLIGFISVAYWYWTEFLGEGDLRLYAMVQFIPLISVPVILIMTQPPYHSRRGYFYLVLAYVIAKICEHFDKEIFSATQVISGHSLKHIIAAISIGFMIPYMKSRKTLKPVNN